RDAIDREQKNLDTFLADPANKGKTVYPNRLRMWLKDAAKSLALAERRVDNLNKSPSDGNFGTGSTNFVKEATALCGKSGDYWLRRHELFARAFEATIFDKLRERDARSDFNVYGVEEDRFANKDDYKGNPYPVGEERKHATAMIAELVSLCAPV